MRAFATAIVVSTFCSAARDGATADKTGRSIASWACSYATNAEAPGQGQAARGPQGCDPVERGLGDGFCPRSVGDGA